MSASDPDGLDRKLLLEADRLALAGVVLVVVFGTVLAATRTGFVGVTKVGPMRNLFAGVVTGVFTLVSIILAINQLVLSRVFGSPDELEDRMSGIVSFRRSAEQHAGVTVAPTEPGAFLATLVGSLGDRANDLSETTEGEVAEYADALVEYADSVGGDLDGRSGTFSVLSAILRDNYSRNVRQARLFRRGRDLPTPADEALVDVERLLKDIGVTRQFLKTVYVQQELANLSRLLMYLGVPALLVSALSVMLYARAGGPSLSGLALEGYVAVALTVSFAPLIVLLSYVLRIATIARLTATVGPFTPKEE